MEEVGVMVCDILVDGYNVIKNNMMFHALEIKNLANARDLLIRQLKNRYRHTEYQVIVVFDGDGNQEQVYHEDHIRIIFSRHGETADAVIVRLAAQARLVGREVETYSDDAEICENVQQEGGNTRTTGQLTQQLTRGPHGMVTRVMHRQAMRKMYGIDPMYKAADEEEDPAPYRGGKKKNKKGSRRRR
jgi:predicted RNA-binding protein with PIN domain